MIVNEKFATILIRFFKLLRIPGIDSKEAIPPACVAWRAVRQTYSYSVPSPQRLFKNSRTVFKPTIFWASIFGQIMEEKVDSWNWLGAKYGDEFTMSHKTLIFKAGIGFSSPDDSWYIVWILEMCWSTGVHVPCPAVQPPTPTVTWRWQFWSRQYLHMELMPPRINSTTEWISHKESIPWNQSLGSLKVQKFRLWILTEWKGSKYETLLYKVQYKKVGRTSLT